MVYLHSNDIRRIRILMRHHTQSHIHLDVCFISLYLHKIGFAMKEYVKKEGFLSAVAQEMSPKSVDDALKKTGKMTVAILAASVVIKGAKFLSKRIKSKQSKNSKKNK